MTVDRDYGKKFIDFRPVAGSFRLGLLTPSALAKDAGLDDVPTDPGAAVLTHRAESRDAIDELVKAVIEAGGQVPEAAEVHGIGYVGSFTDPDGYRWELSSA